TNHPKSLLFPEHLKKNAVVYDVAQPMNLSSEVLQKRPDILRVDGCYVNIPNIDLRFDMGPPPGKTFACLAETILQALEGEIGHHIGEIDLDYLEKMKEIGKKYNFNHADFTCFSKPIDYLNP
ncbi:MAG: shikimate dehydrogenase, partial [Patescibacteria group bacterium]